MGKSTETTPQEIPSNQKVKSDTPLTQGSGSTMKTGQKAPLLGGETTKSTGGTTKPIATK